MKGKRWLGIGVLALLIALGAIWAWRSPALRPDRGPHGELRSGYYTLVDDHGQTVLATALAVAPGDAFVDERNRRYVVERVRGRTATVRYTGTIQLQSGLPAAEVALADAAAGARRAAAAPAGPIAGVASGPATATALPIGGQPKTIVIYHTHDDESYVPTDGRPNIDAGGGVLSVGAALAEMLRVRGFQAVHDTTSHLPHDANAYIRSRRTVVQDLQRYRPYALYDIHRDTPPPDEYRTTIDGRTVARIMIVVGRQNPLLQVNRYEAERLKATADALYPGLVLGIFYGQGSYNQDIDAGVLLIEIGTQFQPRSEAELAAGYLGNVIVAAFGGGP